MMRHLLAIALLSSPSLVVGDDARPSFHFRFGTGEAPAGARRIRPDTAYTPGGAGFDLGSKVVESASSCTSDRPFFFSVALPEGNYRVTATLGDREEPSESTIKAESRRLMVEDVKAGAGQYVSSAFAVNVRTPRLAAGGEVRLKGREKDVLHWDDKLTLEFNGPRPRLHALEIVPADDVTTVYLVGDSTVTDQPYEPWNSWGQMLPRFFGPRVAVANHAESGETLRGSAAARRFDKVYESLKPGDYLFVQFGHNDMKQRGPGVGAFTSYAADLRRVVHEARKRGVHPVLVTSMHRKSLDASGHATNTLGDYPEAVRRIAREESAPLVDLHAMSATFYEALGPDRIGAAFVDGTHHNNYGSYELARCVVEGIRRSVPDLAKLLRPDVPSFDPSHPDPTDSFRVPASPRRDPAKPDGN